MPVFIGVFHVFFAIDDALFEAMFPMLCLRWAELGVKTATTWGRGSIALIKTNHTRPHRHFANKRPTGQEFFLSPKGLITMKQRYTSEGFNASSLQIAMQSELKAGKKLDMRNDHKRLHSTSGL